MCYFVQQGDTSVPATPCNVLEMMRQHLEETDSKTIRRAFADSNDQSLLKTRWRRSYWRILPERLAKVWSGWKLSATGAETLEDSSLSFYKETSDASQDSGAASAESTHTKFSSGTDSIISITTVTCLFKIHYLMLLYSAVCGIVAQVFSWISWSRLILTAKKQKKLIHSLQIRNIYDLSSPSLALISFISLHLQWRPQKIITCFSRTNLITLTHQDHLSPPPHRFVEPPN